MNCSCCDLQASCGLVGSNENLLKHDCIEPSLNYQESINKSVQRHIDVCHDSFSTLRHFHVAARAGRDIRYMKMYMKMT